MKTDDQIRKHVIEEIQWDPQLTKIAPHIGVGVSNEVVTLTGSVDYYGQKLAAERAAYRVKDVKVVAMDIEVKSPENALNITDAKIGQAVRGMLSWNGAVNEDRVNIKVEDGWVTLIGTVNWEYERKAVERAIENIRGVKGVINSIKIKPQESDAVEIKRKIKAAFHRHATVDSGNIQVTTEGHKVTLTGNVRSWQERKDAEDVVWSMPGVTEVDNKLAIEHETYAGE